MKARENFWEEKDELKAYLNQINRESWLFKGQLIFAVIVLTGLIGLVLFFGK